MSRPPAAYADLLVAALRTAVRAPDGEPPSPLPVDGVGVGGLRALAARHRVQPLVRSALRGDPAAAHLLPAVEDGYWQGMTTHLRATAELAAISTALTRASLRWAVFKGPVLAATVYPQPDLRMYSDIDVLVDPSELGAALDALESAGFGLLDSNWDMLRRRMLGQLHLRGPAGVVVDLHWHLVNRPENRSGLRLDTTVLLSRAAEAAVGRLHVPVLDDIDTCIHVAVHACLGGGDRLLWVTDLALALQRVDDLDALVARAGQMGATRHLALMVSRAAALHPSATVARVLHRLAPSAAARRLLELAYAASPVERVASTHTVASFLARSTASSNVGALRTVGRRLRRRVAQSGSHGQQQLGRPDNPHSVLFPAGGAGAREAFLAEVRHYGDRAS